MWYALAHIVHLYAAIAFVGGVIFEALILSALHQHSLPKTTRRQTEQVISKRAVKVMPWIVLAVFSSGLVMAYRYKTLLHDPFASSFGLQLSIKLLLAFSILFHFLIAVRKMRRGTLTVAWSKYIHSAVLIQMLVIVLLAKTMFYVHW